MAALGDGLRCVTLPSPESPERTSLFVPEGTHGDGTPLVLLPGFGLDGRCFSLLAPLAQKRRVLFWNPPNRLPGGSGFAEIADLVLRDARLAGIAGRFVLGGFSLGGPIALETALRAADRLAGLVLIGTMAAWSDVGTAVRIVAGLHGLAPRRKYHRILPRILIPHRWDGAGGSPVNAALRLQMQHRTREYGTRMVNALRADGGIDLRPRLAEIRLPTLVLHGSRDPAVPLRAARTLGAIPGADVVVIEGAGHVPQVSHAGACLDALERFLDGVDG